MTDLTYTPMVPSTSENDEGVFALRYANNSEPAEKPLFEEKNRGFSFLSFSATIVEEKRVVQIKTDKEEQKIEFDTNYATWNNQTKFLANNNFSNDFFNEIVNMGEDAVPLIYAELKKGPTPLVHALNLIYPGEVEYEGYVPLDAVCMLWETILKQKGKV